jgi:hypothetical protein
LGGTIEGWKERYLATVEDLGRRLRALGPEAPSVALAAFGMPEPEPPPDEPYHRYPRGRPSVVGYLRLLWSDLVVPGLLDAASLEAPLWHVLQPAFTLPRLCGPGEPMREELDLGFLGSLRDRSPIQVRCDVEWSAGGVGPKGRGFPWLVGEHGRGHDDLGIVRAPQSPGAYEVHPVLRFRVFDERHPSRFEARRPLERIVVRMVEDPDADVRRQRVPADFSQARVVVRWLRGPREPDGALWLATEYALVARVPDEADAGYYLRPRVVLEAGGAFDLQAEALPPGKRHDDGTGFFKRMNWIPAPPEADGRTARSFWTVLAKSQRVEGKALPGPGKHRVRLELHPDAAEARQAGEDRMVDLGVLRSEPFDLEIE